MNVLIFVMTMLMLLSLLTYAKLESYRSSQIFQVLFEHYMQKDERGYINLAAEKTYDSIIKTVQDKDNKTPKNSPAEGNSRISLHLFKDKSQRDLKPLEWSQTKLLLKNLIAELYKDQKFYMDIEQERPQFLEELMAAITQAADELPKENKWKKTTDLRNLVLPDKELDNLFYLILNGAHYKEVLKPETEISSSQKDECNENEKSAESEGEFVSPKGYFSLLDFVTLKPSQKIRVYLAPKEILNAIFHSESTVGDILLERNQFFNQAKAGANLEDLSKAFEARFDSLRDPSISKETLNYAVTKTNPMNSK